MSAVPANLKTPTPIFASPSSTVISWNCNGFFHHLPDLQILIKEYSPKVIALQETYIPPNREVRLRNYNIFNLPSPQNGRSNGGVLLAVRSEIHAEQIDLNTEPQAVAVRLLLPTSLTVCFFLY